MKSIFTRKPFNDDRRNSKECKKLYTAGLKLRWPSLSNEVEKIRYKTKYITKKQDIEKNEKALQCFEKALKICNDETFSKKIMAAVSFVLFLLERYEEAVKNSDEILNSKTDDKKVLLDSYTTKIGSLFFLERYNDADSCCDVAFNLFPDNAFIIAFKAKALYKLEEFEKSLKKCDKALELFDESCTAWKTKIYCLEELGRYEEALECLGLFSKKESSKHYDLDDEKEFLVGAIEN